jgi:hypothetical protein
MRLASARQQDEYDPTPPTPDEATLIDHALGTLAAQSRAHELELARWLLRAEAAAVHRRFGCASLAEYVERRLGLGARELREKLRVARALEDLPATAEALRTGAQSWSAVRELTRVATPETEVEWLGFSRGRTVRQVERKVAAHQRGDTPRAPRLHAHAPRRLVFEVAPEDLGTVRAALDVVWREVGGGKDSPTPGRLLVALAEVALGRRAVEVAAYQTSVTVCAGCSRTWQRAGGEQVEVSDAVAGCARCDGEVVGLAELSAEDDVLAEDAHDTPATHVGQTVDTRATPRAESATHVGHAHGADAGGHAESPAELATHVGHAHRADAGGHAVSTAERTPHVGHTPAAEPPPHVGHTPAAEPDAPRGSRGRRARAPARARGARRRAAAAAADDPRARGAAALGDAAAAAPGVCAGWWALRGAGVHALAVRGRAPRGAAGAPRAASAGEPGVRVHRASPRAARGRAGAGGLGRGGLGGAARGGARVR